MGGICKWLCRDLGVDRDQADVSVRFVVQRRPDINFWELVPLEGTSRYRAYIDGFTRRGLPIIWYVQFFMKGGPSTHIEDQVGGDEVEAEEDVQSIEGGNEELDYDEQEGGDAENDVASGAPNGEADEGKKFLS